MSANQVQNAHDKIRLALLAMYEMWPVGVEQKDVSAAKVIAEKCGIGTATASSSIKLIEELGILSRRMTYNDNQIAGRHWHYTLLLSQEEAAARLDTELKRQMDTHQKHVSEGAKRAAATRKAPKPPVARDPAIPPFVAERIHERVTLAKQDGEETRAIAGPEGQSALAAKLSPLRQPDDAVALVAAARQYADRARKFEEAVAQLAKVAGDIGIEFDESRVRGSMVLIPDERLETIVPLLPYITSLEQKIVRLGEQVAEQRQKLTGYDQIRSERDRLKTRIEQMIAASVAATSPSMTARRD